MANVRVSGDAPPAVPNVDQSALKARDLGDAFAHPDSPVPDRKPSGLTLMSNSPDAFKGREIRVSHAAGARFDDHTTNRDSFVPHEVSPAPYGNGASKQYAPSYVKFDGMTTNAHDFVPHPVLPSPAVARKPYRMYEAKFDDETTNKAEFPAHDVVSPAPHSQVRKQYAPSGVKFDGHTTNRDSYVAYPVSPSPVVQHKPYRMYEAKFDDETTNRAEFPAHKVVSPSPHSQVKKQYAPSGVKFDGRTTAGESFTPHKVIPSPAVQRKPYRMYEAKFDDETTNRAEFPAHEVVSPSTHSQVRKQYAPSGVNFDGVTTNAADFHAHTIAAKRPPVGLWVENDRTEILIHAGRELPARATRVFSTTEKNQSSVAVRIVQGFSRRASENEVLGVFEMAGIAPGPRGSAQIKITFSMDEKGVLTVEGTDLETRQVQTTQTQTRDK
ncbi:Hsp70 family protein [bacterium]|nr:Hsp70 family protein [bacterium]